MGWTSPVGDGEARGVKYPVSMVGKRHYARTGRRRRPPSHVLLATTPRPAGRGHQALTRGARATPPNHSRKVIAIVLKLVCSMIDLQQLEAHTLGLPRPPPH